MEPTSLHTKQPINQQSNQPSNQQTRKPTKKLPYTNVSYYQPTDQPTFNQPTSQLASQPKNQPVHPTITQHKAKEQNQILQ